MPRIPYLPSDLAEPSALVAAIRARRGGALLELDRILLYSPPLAEGWNGFLGNVRTRLALAPRLRELAICLVAKLNGADYEFHHHAPLFLQAGGTQAQLDAIAGVGEGRLPAALVDVGTADDLLAALDDVGAAVARFTVESTRHVRVSDATFARARAALADDRLLVELVAVIAGYNMVSRVLVAFDVQPA